MTSSQKASIKYNIKLKWQKGEITPDEYNELVAQLDILATSGASYQYVNELLGLYKKKKTKNQAQSGPVSAPAAKGSATGLGGPDPGQAATDKATEEVEKRLKKVYKQAVKELTAKMTDFIDEYGDKLAEKQQQLTEGKITQAELQAWIDAQGQIIDGWKQQIDQASGVLLDANTQAMQIINGQKMGVFAENANWQAYQLTQDTKMSLSFAIYDADAVGRLIKAQPELLPRKVVNGKKDTAWNKKKIANAMTQAIIQGESIPEIAKRIAADTGSDNMTAMVRYARTAMTGAQNAGRMETLHRAKGMGIQCKKCWLATLDNRTRDSHQKMDGIMVEVDQPFVTPLGSKMQYPGDTAGGKPGDIWNCRCTMVYEYEGYPADPEFDQRRDQETGLEIQNMNYTTWKAVKQAGVLNDLNLAKVSLAQAQKAVVKAKIKEDEVYAGLWKDDVTLADYPAKKAGIQAKLDYYDQEITKYKDAMANGATWATPDKLNELKEKKNLLGQYQKNGQLLEARDKALKQVQEAYDKAKLQQKATAPQIAQQAAKKSLSAAGTKSTQFAPDSWDAVRKQAAPLYDYRTQTDKVLRPDLDKTWANLTDEEKFATWMYTLNSHPINQPLSGYNDGWSRGNYAGGPDKTNWGHQDNYGNRNLRSFVHMKKFADANGQPSFKKIITNLTKAIEKSTIKQDIWFKRQSDNAGLAGMLEATGFDFNKLKQLLDGNPSQKELDNAFVGQRGKMNSFTSCGMAKDADWFGNVYYRIYVPKGTKGLYTEPQSHFGRSMGGQDQIYIPGSSYSGIGTEAEVILQRGTEYRITKVTRKGSNYEVEMEVVEQPDYFTYGDEDTYNDGKTRHKK